MDADFIYTKTPAGEEAIRQRTRVMQRNVRMVLILVDGRSSFQDLCLRTGNVKLTENALLELEKGGFIVPLVSGKAEEKKPATVSENPRSAAEKLPSIIPPENTSPPVSPFSPTQGIEIISSMQLSLSAAEHSRAAPAEKAPPLDAPSVLPPPPPPVAPVEDQQEEYPVLSWSVSDLPPPPEAENETPPSPSFSERVKTLLPRGEPADDEPIKLVPRGGKKSLRWSSVLLFLLLLIGVLGLLTVFFPYDSYRPEIEAAMSREIGQTVKLGEIEVVFQPAPAIVLKKVRIAGGRHGFSVNKAVLEPALTSLFSSIKEFRRVSLHGAMFGATAWAVRAPTPTCCSRPPTSAACSPTPPPPSSLRTEATSVAAAASTPSRRCSTTRISTTSSSPSLPSTPPACSLRCRKPHPSPPNSRATPLNRSARSTPTTRPNSPCPSRCWACPAGLGAASGNGSSTAASWATPPAAWPSS